MSQFYMVIITATGCPACDKFKSELENLQNAIKQLPNVKIVLINLPSLNADLPSALPENLRKAVVAFPTIILVKAPSLNASTPFGPTNARVFGYIYPISGGKFIKNTEMTAARNSTNIMKWAQYVVSDERGSVPTYESANSNIRSQQKYNPATAPHPGKLFGQTPPGQPFYPIAGPGPSLQNLRNSNGYSYVVPGQNRTNFGYAGQNTNGNMGYPNQNQNQNGYPSQNGYYG